MKTKKLITLRALQSEMPEIIKEHGDNTDIARAAMVNPILALEMLGYEISDALKHELDYHIRFGPVIKKELLRLEKEVIKAVGRSFDLNDNSSLRKHIHPLIGVKVKQVLFPKEQFAFTLKSSTAKAKFKKQLSDPYEDYRNAHAVMAPLLAFRKIESSVARLGTMNLFQKVLKGKTGHKITINSVRFRLHKEQ